MAETDHDGLVEQRGEEYGESWRMTDRWVQENAELLANAPSPFTLIMMHNKLMRALTSPAKQDHYDDIIGYAKLALRALPVERPAVHWLIEGEARKVHQWRVAAADPSIRAQQLSAHAAWVKAFLKRCYGGQ